MQANLQRLKAVLHCTIFRATCLAILLRHKLHEKLHGVTYPAIIKSRNIFVAASFARSIIKFYFSQRLRQRCNGFEALHSVTPLLQLVSQRFVRSANKNTPLTLTSPSEGLVARQVARNIAGCNTSDLADLAVATEVARKIA